MPATEVMGSPGGHPRVHLRACAITALVGQSPSGELWVGTRSALSMAVSFSTSPPTEKNLFYSAHSRSYRHAFK